MKSLYECLLILFESVNETYILKHPEDAFQFFEVEPDSAAGKLIKYMFELAPENPDTETGYSSPFVGSYNSKKGFACRRWVKDNPAIIAYMEKNNLDFNTVFKGHTFKDYHNTTLEKIDSFPTAADEEIFIAMSLNVKSIGDAKAKTAMKYALFGDENKKLSGKETDLFDKFYNYYEKHKSSIDARAEGYKIEDGDLYTKCTNASVKGDVKDSWKEDGNYEKYPNYTPKADLISKNGKQVSVKKSDGAQAMSGGMNETMTTLMTYSYLLDERTQKKLDSLFKDDDGNPIDWSGVNHERNERLNNTIKDIFENKEANKTFIIAVLTESLTGAGKFGEDSKGTANEIITWTKDGKLIKDDIETYIYRTYEQLSEKDVTINHKSSGKTWSVMRLFLPKHDSPHEPLTDQEREDNKELLEIIKSVRTNESIKSRASQEEEVELKDEDGKTKKVTIKTGPQGGKYYISPSSKRKVYVQKNKSGSYEIKTDK